MPIMRYRIAHTTGKTQSGVVRGGLTVPSAMLPDKNELKPPTKIGKGIIKNDSFFLLFKKIMSFRFLVVYEIR